MAKMKNWQCVRACYMNERRWEAGEIVRAFKQPSKHFLEYDYPVMEGQAETLPETTADISGVQPPEDLPPDMGDQEVVEPRSDEIDEGIQPK